MDNLSPPRRLGAALLSGVVLSFAFGTNADPFVIEAVLGLILLLFLSSGVRPRLAAACGFLHGVAFYGISLRWVHTVMRVHGGLSTWEASGVLASLVAAASVFPALFSFCFCRLSRRSLTTALLAAPFLWVTLEFARTRLPAIGFPWNLLGYAVRDNLTLLQITAVTGVYGLSFLLCAYCALIVWSARALESRGKKRAAGWFLVILAPLVPAVTSMADHWIPQEPPQHLAWLVQTNFPQAPSYPADWMSTHARELDELERLSITAAQNGAELVIWPEVPAPFSMQDAQFAARAERIARATRSGFLFGVVDWKPGSNGGLSPYNSAALMGPSGRLVFLYDKIHLVPFGEYVPLRRWLGFAHQLTAEVGEFQHGSLYRVGGIGGQKLGVFICYEAIFPSEVRRFTERGAGLLINLSNDGWFGRSAAPPQHLMMARVRAVENRRWLLRATNNGYTVAVDPYGRYAARLATDIRGALAAPYGLRSDRTLYARWGDWLAWLCVAATLYFLAAGARHGVPGQK